MRYGLIAENPFERLALGADPRAVEKLLNLLVAMR